MPSRIERLLELLNVLIGADRPLSAETIRGRVPGYPAESASFQRQFERDKAAIRDMGLELVVGEIAGSYPPEVGYRIPRDQAHLPDPGLAPDELAALHLAASAIRLDGIEGSSALWKLGGGQAPAEGGPVVALPGGDHLVVLFRAVAERRTATFGYLGEERTVEPWRLDCRRGRWYLGAFDPSRDGSRHFRLERMDAEVRLGPPGSFERPEGTEGVRMEAWRFGDGPVRLARLLVDADHAEVLRAAAPSATVVEQRADGSVVAELPVTDFEAFRSLVLDFLDHAEILEPPDFRSDIVAWLQAARDRLSA